MNKTLKRGRDGRCRRVQRCRLNTQRVRSRQSHPPDLLGLESGGNGRQLTRLRGQKDPNPIQRCGITGRLRSVARLLRSGISAGRGGRRFVMASADDYRFEVIGPPIKCVIGKRAHRLASAMTRTRTRISLPTWCIVPNAEVALTQVNMAPTGWRR
jgi:hypothetical protein